MRLTIDDNVVVLPQSTSQLVLTAELIRTLATTLGFEMLNDSYMHLYNLILLKTDNMNDEARTRLNADCDLLAAVDPTENPEVSVPRASEHCVLHVVIYHLACCCFAP